MSRPATPGASAPDHERHVLFELQCCVQEMNSALKIIDKSLDNLLANMEKLRRRRKRYEARVEKEESFTAEYLEPTTLSFA
jgi:hypothetical protein